MKKMTMLLIIALLTFTATWADDAKVLPKNVFRVRAVPLFVNSDQYYRSSGDLGPYIQEDLSYSALVGAYTMFHPALANASSMAALGNFKDWDYVDGTKSANQLIGDWNTAYGSDITPFSNPDGSPLFSTSTPWGKIKNQATLNASGSTIYAIEYGLSDKLSIGAIIPYKKATITHSWTWEDDPTDNDKIIAMYSNYASTLTGIATAIADFPADGDPMDKAAMMELYGSVAWAGEDRGAGIEDPFANGIPSSLFAYYAASNPDDIDGYADIFELADFYYPEMNASGVGDIEIGFKYRLAGQGLTDKDKKYAVAVKLGMRLPTGKIVEKYDPAHPQAQFSQIDLGGGQVDYEAHFAADLYTKLAGFPWDITGEIFYNYQMEGELNTALDLLKNVDLDPATTVARLGSTYNVDPGDIIAWSATTSLEVIPMKFSFGFDYEGFTKGRDVYTVPNAPMDNVDDVLTYTNSLGEEAELAVDANNNNQFDALEWADWKELHGEGADLVDTKSYGHKVMVSATFKDFGRKLVPMPYEAYAKYHIPLSGMSNWAPPVIEVGAKLYLKFW